MENNQEKKCPFCNEAKCKCGRKFKWLIVPLLILLSLFFIVAYAVRGYSNAANPRTIVITGKGEVAAAPDISTINFTIRATTPDANTEKLQNDISKAADAVFAKLKALGIEEKDIQTSNYSVNPKYDYTNTGTKLTGYEASETVNVKVRNTENVTKVLNILAEEKVTEVSGPNFEVDDIENLKDEARDLAIQDAKEKAKDLSKSLNVKIKKIVSFSDDSGSMPLPIEYSYNQAKVAGMGMGGDAMLQANIAQGEQKITSNVFITFQIED